MRMIFFVIISMLYLTSCSSKKLNVINTDTKMENFKCDSIKKYKTFVASCGTECVLYYNLDSIKRNKNFKVFYNVKIKVMDSLYDSYNIFYEFQRKGINDFEIIDSNNDTITENSLPRIYNYIKPIEKCIE